MPRDSSGNYSLPFGNPVVPGSIIESSWANTTLSDIAAALTDSLPRDGTAGMTGPFLLEDGSVSAPSLAFENQENSGLFRPADNVVGLAVGGQQPISFAPGGVTIPTGKTFATPVITIGPATDVDSNALIYTRNGAQVGTFRNGSLGTGITGPDGNLKFYVNGANIPIVAAGAQTGGMNVVGPVTADRAFGWATGSLGTGSPLLRFYTGINSAAETGSNAGSNWFLARCNDAGAFLGTAIYVDRATGQVVTGAGSATAGYNLTAHGGLSVPSGNFLMGSGVIIAANGTTAAPSIAFAGGTNYGFSIGSARTNVSSAGVNSAYFSQNSFWQNARIQVNVAGTAPQFELHKTANAAFSALIDSSNKYAILRSDGGGSVSGAALMVLPENSGGVGYITGAQFQFQSAGSAEILFETPTGNPGESGIVTLRAAGTLRSRLYQQVQSGGGSTLIYVSEFPSAGAFCMTVGNNGVITGYNGNCAKPGGGMWADSSDGRLKRDVAGWGMGMDALRPLQVKKFKYDPRLGRGDEEYIGLVAEEAEATPLGPLMVFTDPSIDSPTEFDDVPHEIDEEYQEPYTVQVPGIINDVDPITGEVHPRVVTTTETRLRLKTRKKVMTNRVHRKIELPGGVKGLNATPMLYAMLNALKELDQRLTAGGL